MKRLYIFDMDGTLLPKTTANIEIAKITNTRPDLEDLENRFARGSIDTKAFAAELYGLWDIPDKEIIRKAFDASPKLLNIREVVASISARGDRTCIITMSPDFYAELFYDYGFDFIHASKFPKSDKEMFDPAGILMPEDKYVIAKKICELDGMNIDDSWAFGDSLSDLPLFERLKSTVAINASSELKEISRYNYTGNDLREAFMSLALHPFKLWASV